MSNAIGRLAEAYTCTTCTPTPTKITDEFFSYSKRGEIADVYQHSPNSGSTYYHVTAGYWANGALNTLSSNIANLPTQTYGVDAMGRPSTVTATSSQNPTVVKSTVYDLVNYQTTVTYGSLDSDVFTFDTRTGRMLKYQFNVGSNSDTGTLTWFSNGSLATLQIADTVPGTSDTQTCNYGHDDLSRVSSVNCGNSLWRQTFSYDAFGNVSKDSTGYTGLTFAASYSTSTNQFTTIGTVTPTYDTDGRVTYDGVNHYTWDVDSRLHTVDTSPSSTITYDALGRMVEKAVGATNTQIVYGPSGSKLAVMNGQTLQKAFIPLPGGGTAVYTSSGLAYYRHSDHLGSSRLATTPNKTLYSSTAYAPFGEQYAQTGTIDNSFTGDDQDTVAQTTANVPGGMYDTLMRKQMPVQGRWLSPDPAGLGAVDPSNPQTWNRYAYVMNNPLSLIDPFGESCYGQGPPDAQCTVGNPILGFFDPFSAMTIGSYVVGTQCFDGGCLNWTTVYPNLGLGGQGGPPLCDIGCVIEYMRIALKKIPTCAAAYGGEPDAENLLNKMTVNQVPSPYSGPFQESYNAVTANNNGATPGWQDAASTQVFINPGGTWNGSQYGTFVGSKFATLGVSQQETVLFHEMAHPLWYPYGKELVDTLDLYSPYGGGGISANCGTQPLPPTPPN